MTLFALLHNKVGACFHDGPQFITAHPALQPLRAPLRKASSEKLGTDLSSTFYWDFTIEGDTMGPKWPSSIIYDDEWFGPVKTKADDNWQMTTGRFGRHHEALARRARPFLEDKNMYSPYGFLSDPCVSSTSTVLSAPRASAASRPSRPCPP